VLWTLAALVIGAAPTPSPVPSSNVPDNAVTPGVWGFVITAAIGIAVILLILDMIRRLRKVNYRAEVRERIAAEQAAAAAEGESPKAE
jgi:multisubunit Na+/H+ antiporter MnhC subunit